MKGVFHYIRHSLSMKLSVGILLLAIPIFVLSLGLLYMESRRNIRKEAMEHATSVLNATTQRLERQLNAVANATNANGWMVENNLQPDSLLIFSRRIVAVNNDVSGCSITTEPDVFPEYGRYFSAYSVRKKVKGADGAATRDTIETIREKEYEYFDKPWYKTPYLKGEACWIEPFDDNNEGTLSADGIIASYCKPLYNDKGVFVGVISTDLLLPKLASVIQAEKPYPHSYFMLVGANGHFFVHPDSTLLYSHTIFSETDPKRHPDIIALGHEMTAGKKGAMKVDFGNDPCLVCYQPVEGTDWSLALVCQDSDILHSYNKLSSIITLSIIFGLLLILFFCSRIVSHATRPLNRLVEQLQRLSYGQYDELIQHTTREDAVGQIQDSFAKMQESIEDHIADIKSLNDETIKRNEELRQANEMVEEAGRQKMAFIQNMTHQIRTPLNIIMGFAQLLRDNIKDLPPEEVKSITDMMHHNTMTLNRMVLMLYDSSEIGESEEENTHNQTEKVLCNDVARECIAHTHMHFPDLPVKFESELPDTYSIRTNRLYLMRSLREILYNSAKYSDKQNVSFLISETKTTVRFVFQDTGPGIATEHHEMIFVPFTKVNDLSEGLGLGLPLTKRHISNLGGTITVDADYHEGCRFIIEIPKGDEQGE